MVTSVCTHVALHIFLNFGSFSAATELCVISFSACVLVHADIILIKYMCKMYIIVHEW